MKAKIIDVKKIVKAQDGGGGTPPPGMPKAPKNIEGFDDEEKEKEPGEEGEGEGDQDQKKPGDQGQKTPGNQGQKKTGNQGDQGDQGDQGEEGPEMPGSGQGGGEQRGFKEIDPMGPGEYRYETTPWSPPAERTVVGEVLPTGSLGDSEKKDPEQAKEKWKDSTTAAESQSQGNIPGKIKRALEKMRAAVIDWKEELRKYIDDAVSKSKYVLPSRRFLGTGKAQYGYKKYNEDFECIVVAIDTSGSISDKMVGQFLSEVKSIVEITSPQDLYIIFCHSRIYRVDHLKPGDPIEVGELQSGGTEFYPPFKWTEENVIDQGITPSVFIYFTDGEATFPDVNKYQIDRYEDKVIWVFLTFNGEKFPYPQPFGKRIDITLPNKGIKTI